MEERGREKEREGGREEGKGMKGRGGEGKEEKGMEEGKEGGEGGREEKREGGKEKGKELNKIPSLMYQDGLMRPHLPVTTPVSLAG
jgi:hypothetical protein